jgi:hypothetical protein
VATTHQFKFAVSDVDLTPEQIEKVGQAVAQAGALALADLAPRESITLQVRPDLWWRGIPADDLRKQLQGFASKQAGGR